MATLLLPPICEQPVAMARRRKSTLIQSRSKDQTLYWCRHIGELQVVAVLEDGVTEGAKLFRVAT
uniref:Uncharacterized protein n=2 Tax=Oryza sativa subsp. japonica TaxID=39947 RepID=Q6ZKW8_ORYSJ|nr:hypothetical protein [Oryza sativa Japonica Group]BAD02995.1 hypothetical protein [Oryza sativa Japonica Group]